MKPSTGRPLLRRLARAVRASALIGRGDRVAVALSGGPDSVALLWLLRLLEPELGHAVVGAIHIHHGLRGPEADRDEAFCQALAARLALPFEVGRADTRAHARARRCSIETAAREVRYDGLTAAAARLDATLVATGHTADDQAETVLFRLLRGTTVRGASAIRARRGLFVRPLLGCRRQDLRAFLSDRGEAFCEDSSNATAVAARNRLRHELLPVVERLAPGAVPALARFAALSADDDLVLEEGAISAARSIVLLKEDGVQLNRGALSALPAALARRVVRQALEAAGARGVRAVQVEAIRALAARDGRRSRLDLRHLDVERVGEWLWLRPRTVRSAALPFCRPLPVPGAAALPEAGVVIEAIEADAGGVPLASGRGDSATVEAAAIARPLTVRSRRPGDRFRPLGAPGRRRLKSVLIDRKVAAGERDRLPLVVDRDGRIIWVVGVGVAHECRVTAPDSKVVVLKARRTSKASK